MSSPEKPPDSDEVNRTKSDNLNTTTKSSPLLSHHIDKAKPDKKHVNRASRFSQSDGSIIKPEENADLKKKINKVWSRSGGSKEEKGKVLVDVPENDAVEAGLVAELDNLNFNNESGENAWVHSELVRARDSLENLNSSSWSSRTTSGDVGNSKSASFPQEKHTLSDTPHSDSSLATSGNQPSCSAMRVLTWDPWDKMGRKPKKENKRRKMAETVQLPKATPPEELQGSQMKDEEPAAPEEEAESYEYRPYQPPPPKAVDFTNEVMVVYFNGEDVVGESKEPLKKELEQQVRNKEMRKGHLPTMLGTKRKFPDDFKGAWF